MTLPETGPNGPDRDEPISPPKTPEKAPENGEGAEVPDVSGQAADAAGEAELAERMDEVAVATTSIFRRALRDMFLLVAVLTVVGIMVGLLVDGAAGVWGAVIGAGLTIVFSGTTVLSMLKTAGSSPQTTMMVVLGGWIGKMIVLVAALAILGQFDFYNRFVLAAVILIGVMGSVLLDYRAVAKGRVPYVSP